jgi:hypothetical protein
MLIKVSLIRRFEKDKTVGMPLNLFLWWYGRGLGVIMDKEEKVIVCLLRDQTYSFWQAQYYLQVLSW